jgi:phosphoglycerate dehydrogenase-like enzyme
MKATLLKQISSINAFSAFKMSSLVNHKHRVFVTQPIPQQAVDIFNSNNIEIVVNDGLLTRKSLLESVKDIDGLFCNLNEKIDKELLYSAKNLKVNQKRSE